MENNNKSPIVVSIAGLPKRKQKKVVKRVTGEVKKDKDFKRSIRKANRKTGQKLPKTVKEAAVKAAVEATLGVKTGEPAIPEKKSGLEVYTELVGRFAAARRKYKERQKKKLKAARKMGYDLETGFYKLQKADKLKKAKRVKFKKTKKTKGK